MNVGIDLGSSAVKVATGAGVLAMRGIVDPELSARMGTTAPVVRHVGNALSLCSPHESYVLALSRVLGETPSPEDVTVVVPGWWSPRAQAMVTRTLSAQYPGTARLVEHAPAALRAFSATRPLADPVVAVLDVGATCTSATVVVDDAVGEPRALGPSLVLPGRGGDRLDALLLRHVLETIEAGGWSRDHADPDVRRAAHAFQNDIRIAKEQLSTQPVVRVAPRLPGVETEVRVVRAEYDDVARPVISEIVGMLTTCIAESGADVGAILLVGGGAPTPMLTQMISVELGLPVLLDDEPVSTAARGAMRFSLDRSGRDKRARGRGAARQGARGSRRTAVRPALAARIVSLPAPGAPAVPELVVAASRPPEPEGPAVDESPETVEAPPAEPVESSRPAADRESTDVSMPPVAQFPASARKAPVSRHAAPLAERPRPDEQVGRLSYRGRRRADAAPAPESESEEDSGSADEKSTPAPRPARYWSPR